MFQSSILRAIGQKRILPTTRNIPLNIRPASRNLRLDSRPYHATQARLHEIRKAEPATVWNDCPCKGICMTGWQFIGMTIAMVVVRVVIEADWSEDAIRKKNEEKLDLEEAKLLGRRSRLSRKAEHADSEVEEDV